MLRVFVADDEPPARRKLIRLLATQPDIEIIGEAASGLDAVLGIENGQPDLIFLDVQMPDLDGFQVAAALRSDPRPEIIFVTAYDQYALKAFEIHALGYLLKPYDDQRFFDVLERARTRIHKPSGDQAKVPEALLDLLKKSTAPARYPARWLVRDGDRALLLPSTAIEWMESSRNLVLFHSASKTYSSRTTLDSVETQLDPSEFARISRSHIVNLGRVVELRPWFHGEYQVSMQDGSELTWTRNFLHNLPARP